MFGRKQRKRRRVAREKATLARQLAPTAASLKAGLNLTTGDIPVLVISYNNGSYVEQMVSALTSLNIVPIILDNASTATRTLEVLKRVEDDNSAVVIRVAHNFGHLVGFKEPLYRLLPDVFAYTDPDLQLPTSLPGDFLAELKALACHYGCYKAGLALQRPDSSSASTPLFTKTNSRPFPWSRSYSCLQWEQRYWQRPLVHPTLEVWAAPIDTTFAVYIKQNYHGDFFDAVRVGGHYECIHLPWHPDIDPMSMDELTNYRQNNISSSWIS